MAHIKTKVFSFLRYNKFEFGDQKVSQFVLLEIKYLFSIVFFYFHKSDGFQDRFHTHAFNAISFKLFGKYDEHILINEKTGEYNIRKRNNIIQYFPKDTYHRIAKSTGCMTVLFSGPWRKKWKEYIDGQVFHYTWGRKNNNIE
jgi:hypothetical protein